MNTAILHDTFAILKHHFHEGRGTILKYDASYSLRNYAHFCQDYLTFSIVSCRCFSIKLTT